MPAVLHKHKATSGGTYYEFIEQCYFFGLSSEKRASYRYSSLVPIYACLVSGGELHNPMSTYYKFIRVQLKSLHRPRS